MLGFILLFTFIASISSLLIVAVLLIKQNLFKRLSFHLVSFAAGALLAAGMMDTLPEAINLSKAAFVITTFSIAAFFIIERLFVNIHHHEAEEGEDKKIKLPIEFLLFGDGLHNFIDGISIASTFLISFPLGVVTSLAVFVHEIPHELGDFGIMLHMGYKKWTIIGFNILAGVVAFVGAITGFVLGNKIEGILPILLAITSANFIYLSLSDLLPEMHTKSKGKNAVIDTFFFLLGITLITILTNFLKV